MQPFFLNNSRNRFHGLVSTCKIGHDCVLKVLRITAFHCKWDLPGELDGLITSSFKFIHKSLMPLRFFKTLLVVFLHPKVFTICSWLITSSRYLLTSTMSESHICLGVPFGQLSEMSMLLIFSIIQCLFARWRAFWLNVPVCSWQDSSCICANFLSNFRSSF